MESVAPYPSPTSNCGALSRRSLAAVSGRFIAARRPKVVLVRVGELSSESRDKSHIISKHWDNQTNWKPAASDKPGGNDEEVFRDANGASRNIEEEQLHLDSSRRQNFGHSWNHHQYTSQHWYSSGSGQPCANRIHYFLSERARHATGGMVPLNAKDDDAKVQQPRTSSHASSTSRYSTAARSSHQLHLKKSSGCPNPNSTDARLPHSTFYHQRTNSSVVLIPDNIIIPVEIAPAPPKPTYLPQRVRVAPPPDGKRANDCDDSNSLPPQVKRVKNSSRDETARLEGTFHKLDLLCSATLELGPLQDNPTGCSCPKSKCIALYCDCFKAGRRCDPQTCSCINCKNTLMESGPNGARSKAIQSILARNPRAFTNAGASTSTNKPPRGEQNCNCIRSRCLKLYCTCFQVRKSCNPQHCTCIGCLNTHEDLGGHRQAAIDATLEKRPDAFDTPKVKEIGSGCACKNNRCIRKYCECFRTKLACNKKCSCRECENQETDRIKKEPLDSVGSSVSSSKPVVTKCS